MNKLPTRKLLLVRKVFIVQILQEKQFLENNFYISYGRQSIKKSRNLVFACIKKKTTRPKNRKGLYDRYYNTMWYYIMVIYHLSKCFVHIYKYI